MGKIIPGRNNLDKISKEQEVSCINRSGRHNTKQVCKFSESHKFCSSSRDPTSDRADAFYSLRSVLILLLHMLLGARNKTLLR